MNVTAESYNLTNEFTFINNDKLIDKIKAKEGEKTFDTVLDIGCGSGNVTENVGGKFKFNRLVGMDIDPKMIEFATNNSKLANSTFLQADLQSPFDNLPQELKQLQGKCSLIYSVYTLHWCPDIESCVSNIGKWLAPGARAYILMAQLTSALVAPDDKRDLIEAAVPLVKGKNYENAWREAVVKNGMTMEVNEITSELPFQEEFIDTMFNPMTETLIKKYIQEDAIVKVCVDELRRRMVPKNVGGQLKYIYKMNSWLLVLEKSAGN